MHLPRLESASQKHTLTRIVVHLEAGSDLADPLEVMDAPKEKGVTGPGRIVLPVLAYERFWI